MSDLVDTFKTLGLSDQKANEIVRNEGVSSTLLSIIEETKNQSGNPSEFGILLYHLASVIKPQIKERFKFIVTYIINKKIDSTLRIDAAVEHLLSHAHTDVDVHEFEKACGIGVEVTPEDIENAVETAINKYKDDIQTKRYRFNTGFLLQDIRKILKWADFKDVKSEIEVQMLDLLGPKTDEDRLPVSKKKNKELLTNSAKKQNKVEGARLETLTIDEMISKLQLHKPGDNFKTLGYVITPTTKILLKQHLEDTDGKVRTRFPPEPNGILHIGHAKAININFGYAALHKGVCFLRFDDTNPEKEEEQFFKGIIDMVEWLGYTPFKITHSSDYFDQLFEWAITLIEKGYAYVCHQKQEDIQGFNPPPSPWRTRSVAENLKLFQDMKNGKMAEGECTLRMKITLEEGKQDPVAYRIKYLPHPKTGDKWCIYPTYDYTHCLCDSIENITHSLCTKEFQSRRSSYYWLCNALNIYCPVQWEYGRLNMNYTVVSKRKIAKLIKTGIVEDWDDPRLFTLTALRRRGIPPEAINRFCAQIGVTGAQTVVDPVMLDSCARDVLNQTAPRAMVVMDPIEVEIESGYNGEKGFNVPDFPAEPDRARHVVQFSQQFFIERDDFRKVTEAGYKRLTPDQVVGLRYTPYLIKVISVIYTDEREETVKKLIVQAKLLSTEPKPKAFIHWVSNPVKITVQLYSNLFNHKNPEDPALLPNGYLNDVMTVSLIICEAIADKSLLNSCPAFKQFQFERQGYFCVDPDSTKENVIFNRTVPLKEDAGKF